MEFMAQNDVLKGLMWKAMNCMASSVQFISRFKSGLAFDRSFQKVFEIIEHIFCILTPRLYKNLIYFIIYNMKAGVAQSLWHICTIAFWLAAATGTQLQSQLHHHATLIQYREGLGNEFFHGMVQRVDLVSELRGY